MNVLTCFSTVTQCNMNNRFNYLVYIAMKLHKMSTVMSSNLLFCPTNWTKPPKKPFLASNKFSPTRRLKCTKKKKKKDKWWINQSTDGRIFVFFAKKQEFSVTLTIWHNWSSLSSAQWPGTKSVFNVAILHVKLYCVDLQCVGAGGLRRSNMSQASSWTTIKSCTT